MQIFMKVVCGKILNQLINVLFCLKPITCLYNAHWFNPYDETPYSAEVIYFVVQNLPRSERFKFENILLAGVIPGPQEPRKHKYFSLSHC